METVEATITWSPDADRLAVWAEPYSGRPFEPEPFADSILASLLIEVDEEGNETGRVAGAQMLGFLEFNGWETVPSLPILWQLPGWEPLPLDALLKRLQAELREQQGRELRKVA